MAVRYSHAILERINFFSISEAVERKTPIEEWKKLGEELASVYRDQKGSFEKDIGGRFQDNGESWISQVDRASVWPAVVLPQMVLDKYTVECYVVPMQKNGSFKSICAFELPAYPKIGLRMERELAEQDTDHMKDIFDGMVDETEKIAYALYKPFVSLVERRLGKEAEFGVSWKEVYFKFLALDADTEEELKATVGTMESISGEKMTYRFSEGINEAKNPSAPELYGLYGITKSPNLLDTKFLQQEVVGVTSAKTAEELRIMANRIIFGQLTRLQ